MYIQFHYFNNGPGRPSKPVYPFSKMKRGDWFSVPGDAAPNVRMAAYNHRKRDDKFHVSVYRDGDRVRVERQ